MTGNCKRGLRLIPLSRNCSNNYSQDAKVVQDMFYNYFNSPKGAVPSQLDMVSATMGKWHWNLKEMVSLLNIKQGTPIHIPKYKATHCFIIAKCWKKQLPKCNIFNEEVVQ